MKPSIAVITPYYKEPNEILRQCHESVLSQKGSFNLEHFMVADGHAQKEIDYWTCNHTILQKSHSDNGNTPRSIGCQLAESEGYDFISFLDADNWYHENHFNSMLKIFTEEQKPITTSFRTYHLPDGQQMNIRESDEDSLKHVDTSCILLHRDAFELNSLWAKMPKPLSPICDRVFMAGIRHKRFNFASTKLRTVAFRSQYEAHYKAGGHNPPDDAKGVGELRPSYEYLQTLKGISECIQSMGFWPVSYF